MNHGSSDVEMYGSAALKQGEVYGTFSCATTSNMAMWILALSAILPLSFVLAEEPDSGLFTLVAMHEQLCMTSKSRDAKAHVEARPCGSQKIPQNQLWVHDNNLQMVTLADGLCLDCDCDISCDPYCESLACFTLRMFECDGGDDQQWKWNVGDLTVTNQKYGLCLELDSSSQEMTVDNCDTEELSQKFDKKWWKVDNMESVKIHLIYPFRAIVVAVLVTVAVLLILWYWYMKDEGCRRSWMMGEWTRSHPASSLAQPLNDWGKQALEEISGLKDLILYVRGQVAHIATTIDEQEDSASDCTVGSWTHVAEEPCCFLPDTYLKKVTTAGGYEFASAKTLSQGTQVVAADGTVIEVLRPPEQHEVEAVIQLQAGPSCLVVSPNHRIVTPEKTIQARDLEVGCDLLLDQTRAKLTSLDWRLEPTIVLKISFTPDLPVAGYLFPPGILSKGSRQKPVARRGMRKPQQGGDKWSIPDTEAPLTP